jgi:hypothetical protein
MRAVARIVVALGRNALAANQPAHETVERTWPTDRVAPLVLRAAMTPTTTASAAALAPIAQAFLAALTPMSAGADLLNRGLALRFDGVASINVPGLGVPTADFVAEGEAIPTTEALPAPAARLTRHKIAVIATATREMLHNPAAEDLIRQILIETTGPALDRVLLSTSAASLDHPAGLLNGIAPLPATGDLIDKLVAVASAVAPVAGNGSIAIVAAAAQAAAINLRLPRAPIYPILSSTTLTPGTIIAVALPALVSAVEIIRVEASTDAVVHEESSSPAVNIGGGVMAHPLRSFFQSDTVGLKLRWPISWALRDPRAVAWMQGV